MKEKITKQGIKYVEWTCRFCGKQSFSPINNLHSHEKFCTSNPNAIPNPWKGKPSPLKGRHWSKETRDHMKASGKIGGYRRGAGTGKHGWYKGLYCMSSWELAWVVYQLDQGQEVKQCKEFFEYTFEGEVHKYLPDFKIGETYYEIKGWNRPDTEAKLQQFPKDKTIILILGKNNEKYLNYAKNKYGNNFWEVLYEGEKVQDRKSDLWAKHLEDLKDSRWQALMQSGIDFKSYGWKTQVKQLLGFRWHYIQSNYPEFYKTCYFNGSKQ